MFGDYIHVYDMQQSKEDGATVAIYFESRLAKLSLKDADLPAIDAEVDELAEDEEESQQAKLKSRWAALEKVVELQPMSGEGFYQLGMAYHHANRPDDVTRILKRLVGFEPKRAKNLARDTERADLMKYIPDLPF